MRGCGFRREVLVFSREVFGALVTGTPLSGANLAKTSRKPRQNLALSSPERLSALSLLLRTVSLNRIRSMPYKRPPGSPNLDIDGPCFGVRRRYFYVRETSDKRQRNVRLVRFRCSRRSTGSSRFPKPLRTVSPGVFSPSNGCETDAGDWITTFDQEACRRKPNHRPRVDPTACLDHGATRHRRSLPRIESQS